MIFRTIVTLVIVGMLSIIGMSFARLIGGGDAKLFAVGMVAGIFFCCIYTILFDREIAQ